jgi:[ribosomal protein S5]-alanine N-acetyltransferase
MADKPQHPPTIELDGARLRPLRVADAAALYAYLRDPVVTELTRCPVASVPMVEAMIERSLTRSIHHLELNLVGIGAELRGVHRCCSRR